MTRKEFIEGFAISAAAVAVGSIPGNEVSAAERKKKSVSGNTAGIDIVEMRKKAAHRTRRVLRGLRQLAQV